MTLRGRLAVGLAVIAALMIVPLFVALASLEQLHRSAIALRDREFAASLVVSRMRSAVQELGHAETALLFVHDETSRRRMGRGLQTLAAMTDTLDGFALDTVASQVRRAVADVAAAAPQELAQAVSDSVAGAEAISTTTVRPALRRVEQLLGDAERVLALRTQGRVHAAARIAADARMTSALALVLVLALAFVAGLWLTRSISRPVSELERGLRAVADGDFTYALPGESALRTDEFGRLAESFQSMSRQLAELDRLKSEFVSIASHELRTPINVILGYLQLLGEGAYGSTTPKQREIIATLQAQGQTLARLVKQLLDLSRLEAGTVRLEPRPLSPRDFLADIERAFRVLADQCGVTFRVIARDSLPGEATWDADRMSEVLANLLTNALKFTPRGGRVEVIADGDPGAGAGSVQLDVRDTGAGIPPDQLPRVFEKFYQADNQGAAAQGGAGLGLAIAKEIVEAHGGTVAVESAPGRGTTFTINLPSHTAARRSAPAPVAVVGG